MTQNEGPQELLSNLTAEKDIEGIAVLARRLEANGELTPRLLVATAEAFRDAGDSAAAMEWFGRVQPQHPPYPYARAQMTRLRFVAGDYEGVIAMTGEVELKDLTEPLAVSRTRALVAVGSYAEALTLVSQIQQLRPLTPGLLEAGAEAALAADGWSAAYEFWDRAAKVAATPRSEFRRAVALFHLDNFREAEPEFHRLAANSEFFVRCKLYMGRIHQKNGDSDLAIAELRDVLEKEPDNEIALDALLRQYIEVREFDSAREIFDRGVALYPQRFPLEMYEFLVNERQGRLRAGLKPFKDGGIDHQLSEAVKEKVATAFYFAGQFDPARRLSLQLDVDKARIIKAKISLATGRRVGVDKLPSNREGSLIKAVALYLAGKTAQCIEVIDSLEPTPNESLAAGNLRNLAVSGRILSAEYFDKASKVPVTPDEPLPVIQQLWVGSNLSYIEKLSIRSFLAVGHTVHLYSYDPNIDVPEGCTVRDASEILPEESIFAHSQRTGRSKGSLAGFADLFRWKLIYQKGGAWADADVICLAPIVSRRIISTELARLGALVLPAVTNCFFAAEKGEAAFLAAYEQASKLDSSALLWGEIGIHKMAQIVAEEGWGDRLTAPTDICPIPPFRMIDAIMGSFDVEAVLQRTGCRAVHLYNEVMRMVGMDKNGTFPSHGLIGVLEKRVSALEAQMEAH